MPTDEQPLRVLVVDDDVVDRKSVTRSLRRSRLSAQVETATSAEEGIQRLHDETFDVALVDYHLPRLNGREFLGRLEAQVPVILLTGNDDEEIARECMQAGAQDYLVKGRVDDVALVRSVRYALERFRLRTDLEGRLGVIAAQSEALAAKNEELRLYTGAAAHDLSAPLRRVKTFASLLQSQRATQLDAQGLGWLRSLRGSVDAMQDLVGGLMILADLSQGAGVVFERLALNDLAHEVADELAGDGDGQVVIESLPELTGDRVGLRRLLQNLIGNGLKYARPGETARVVVTSEPQRVDDRPGWSLHVCDNGIGFEPRFAAQVFEPFARLHTRAEYTGSGLGLAICSKVVDVHGGQIEVRSVPGVGSRFSVWLPATPAG